MSTLHEWTDTFEIKDMNGSLLAKVTSKSLGTEPGGPRTITATSPDGEPLAEIRKNLFQLKDLRDMEALKDKPLYEAFDSNGRLFACVRYRPMKPDARFSSQVPCIINAQGEEVARLDYGGILSRNWTLKTAQGLTVATIKVQILPRKTYTISLQDVNTEPYMILLPFFGMMPEPSPTTPHPATPPFKK
jgi:uncharacterized protein YxjI